MKIVIGAIIGAVLASGLFVARNAVAPKLPQVLASSVSPDSKWICEIVDIDPRGPVCHILIHGQGYQNRTKLERGFKGECIVMDLDSESIPPDVSFSWGGPVVTIEGYPITDPVSLRCTNEGGVIPHDQGSPGP